MCQCMHTRTPMQSAFADFVATRGSRQALANVRALLDRPAGPCLVFLCGPPGVGKSHLLRAARLQHGASGRDAAVPDLVREVLGDARSRYDERLSTIDDLRVLAGMPRTQLEVGRHLADRIRAGVRVVAAAGVAPTALPQLTAQLRRSDGAVFATLTPPSVREMTTILRIEASRVGVRLDAANRPQDGGPLPWRRPGGAGRGGQAPTHPVAGGHAPAAEGDRRR